MNRNPLPCKTLATFALLLGSLWLGCGPSLEDWAEETTWRPVADPNGVCDGRGGLALTFTEPGSPILAAAMAPSPNAWGPDVPRSLPRAVIPHRCKKALDWKRNQLLYVIDQLVQEGFNYCHHHNPYWTAPSKERCRASGGARGVDCSNFTSLAYLIALGGPWFTSHIESQAGTGARPDLAPGRRVIAPTEPFLAAVDRLRPGDLLFIANPAHGRVVHVQIWTGKRVDIDFDRAALTSSHAARAQPGDFVVVDSTGDGPDSGPRYRLFNKSPKMVHQPDGPSWWRYHSARRVILNPDFVWPVDSIVLSNRYYPSDDPERPTHNGTADLQSPQMTPVFAARHGQVVLNRDFDGRNFGGFAVRLAHADDEGVTRYSTYYAHLFEKPRHLEVGDRVKTGDLIGYVGRTGNARTSHLHFAIQRREAPGMPWQTLYARDAPGTNEAHWGLPRFSSIRQGNAIDLDGLKLPDLPDLSARPHLQRHWDLHRARYPMRIKHAQATVYAAPGIEAGTAHPPLAGDAVVKVTGFKDGFYRVEGGGYVLRDDLTDVGRRSKQTRIVPRPGEESVALRCRPNNTRRACDNGIYVRLLAGTLVNAYQRCPNLGDEDDQSAAACVLWRGTSDPVVNALPPKERRANQLVVSYYHVAPDQLADTARMTVLAIAPRLMFYDRPRGTVVQSYEHDGLDAAKTSPYARLGLLTVRERDGGYYRVRVDLDGNGESEDYWIAANTTTGIR